MQRSHQPWGKNFLNGSETAARRRLDHPDPTENRHDPAISPAFSVVRLHLSRVSTMLRPPNMANRAIWSMRKRHEWLATPLKKRRVKRATRVRCGLQDAIDRKSGNASEKQ